MNRLRLRNSRQLACHAGTTLEWLIATRNRRTSRKGLHHTAQDLSSLSQVIPLPETSIPRRPVFSPDRGRAQPCARLIVRVGLSAAGLTSITFAPVPRSISSMDNEEPAQRSQIDPNATHRAIDRADP